MYKFLEQIVSDHMTSDVITVSPTMSMRELGQRFKETDFNSFPVMANGQVVGIVSKFDYLACFEFTPARMVPHYDDLMRRVVASVMVLPRHFGLFQTRRFTTTTSYSDYIKV